LCSSFNNGYSKIKTALRTAIREVIQEGNQRGTSNGITSLPEVWEAIIEKGGDY
jgi:hypothetical protein